MIFWSSVPGGSNFLLHGVEVTGTGQGGVILQGGDRTSLTPANHTVENCTIHRFARVLQKYTPGLCLCGVGHVLRSSRISDGAHFGMLLTGNDHTIRNNHFFNLVYGGADAGAICECLPSPCVVCGAMSSAVCSHIAPPCWLPRSRHAT